MNADKLLGLIEKDPDLFLSVSYVPKDSSDPFSQWIHVVDVVESLPGGTRIKPFQSRPCPRSYGALLKLIEDGKVLSVGYFSGYGELYKNV